MLAAPVAKSIVFILWTFDSFRNGEGDIAFCELFQLE
jgi:hypothetical protein